MNQIAKYFNGEKAESFVFITIGIAALLMAVYFVFVLKTSFWKGVAIPFFIVACLEIMVGYVIVTRTPYDISRVENYLKNEPQNIKKVEIPRMEKVLQNFVIYRYFEIVLLFFGILIMYSTKNDSLWRGLGLGLFIKASIVLCLDFFAEKRGLVYFEYLKEGIDKL